MNMDEMRDYLIDYLSKENQEKFKQQLPLYEDKDMTLRGLFNIRPGVEIAEDFLRVQDSYLKEIARLKGITDVNDIEAIPSNSRISMWRGDITTLRIGAIVNAANSGMQGCFLPNHLCIDNEIHTFSGVQLRIECSKIMKKQGYGEPTGIAKITSAYNLPCDYVIHTVGPIIYDKVTQEDESLLASSYKSCLEIARDNGVKSIALCCISTGVFRFPGESAARIAYKTVSEFLENDNSLEKVVFNVFTQKDEEIYKKLLGV